MEAILFVYVVICTFLGVMFVILCIKMWIMSDDVKEIKTILTKHLNSNPANGDSSSQKITSVAKKANRYADTTWMASSGLISKVTLCYYFCPDGKHYTFTSSEMSGEMAEEGLYEVISDNISLKSLDGNHVRNLNYSRTDEALIPSDHSDDMYKKV